VDSIHGLWTTSGLSARWTGHGWQYRARWSWASSRSSAQGCRPRVGEGEDSAGDPFQASPKVERWRVGRAMMVKVAVGRALVRGGSGLIIWARRSGGEAMGGGDAGAPFYRVRGGAGRPGDGGKHAASVVHHDGGGGGCFGRGSAGAVVGSDEGGALAVLGADGGCQEAGRAHVRQVVAVAQWEGKGGWGGRGG
jgi:hypothetical protein